MLGAYGLSGLNEKEGSQLATLASASVNEARKQQLQLAEAPRRDPLEAST